MPPAELFQAVQCAPGSQICTCHHVRVDLGNAAVLETFLFRSVTPINLTGSKKKKVSPGRWLSDKIFIPQTQGLEFETPGSSALEALGPLSPGCFCLDILTYLCLPGPFFLQCLLEVRSHHLREPTTTFLVYLCLTLPHFCGERGSRDRGIPRGSQDS